MNRTEQSWAEQNRTEQSRAEQSRTEQSRTEQFMTSERVTRVKIQRRQKETWMEQGMLYNGIAMTILIAPPWSSMNTFPYYSERCRCITHLYCFRYAVSVSEKKVHERRVSKCTRINTYWLMFFDDKWRWKFSLRMPRLYTDTCTCQRAVIILYKSTTNCLSK